MSFSNLFKEFKSTATWLQFPFICEVGLSVKGDVETGHERAAVVQERRPESGEGGGQSQAQGEVVLGGRCGWGRPSTECPGLAGETVGTDLGSRSSELASVAPSGARWTCLQLDLHDILLVYLNRRYGHLKSVKLCASLLVKSLYTSDLCFDPGECCTYVLCSSCSLPAPALSPNP